MTEFFHKVLVLDIKRRGVGLQFIESLKARTLYINANEMLFLEIVNEKKTKKIQEFCEEKKVDIYVDFVTEITLKNGHRLLVVGDPDYHIQKIKNTKGIL